ncbi:TetR/AcrR family transcriptional regulator [Streptomyces sp. NPDC088387]|uniref:TetR/AcrR family transcriptional regulator n=1 Tax=Streptomyces sp. NPDC088387 TaxID=3365859 RepID=UPI003812C708
MGARSYHHGDLRAALIASAERALQENGAAGINLRELARDIDVSHAAPRRHFKDKHDLLDALAVSGYLRLTAALDEVDDESLPFAQRLTARADAYLRFAAANGALLELMVSRKHRPDTNAELPAALDRTMRPILQMITEAQERGEIVNEDPEGIALSLGASIHGLAVLVANGAFEADSAVDALETLLRHLLRGLTPPQAAS